MALMRRTEGQWIAWVGMNEEGRLLHHLLPDSVLMEGSQSPEQNKTPSNDFSGEKSGC